MNGIAAIGEAVSSLADVNMDSEMQKADAIVTLISATAALSADWSKQWDIDSETYFADSLKAVGDQSASAIAAADYATYQQHLQQGELEMGTQDNVLQTNKTVLKGLGNAMDQVYSLMQGPIQMTKSTSKAILAMANS